MKLSFVLYLWLCCSCSAPREAAVYYKARSLDDGSLVLIYSKEMKRSGDRYRVADTVIIPKQIGYSKIELCPQFVVLGKL
jgi:hypothetical protein